MPVGTQNEFCASAKSCRYIDDIVSLIINNFIFTIRGWSVVYSWTIWEKFAWFCVKNSLKNFISLHKYFFSLHNLMKHHFRSRFFGSLDRYLHFSIIYNIMLLYEFVEILFYIKFEYFLYDSFWRERNSGVWRFITIKDRIVLIF